MSFGKLAPVIAAPALLLLAAPPAAAAEDAPIQIGQFGSWTAYTMPETHHDACYVVEFPEHADDSVPRGKPDIMITHRPSEHTYNVVSIDLAYDLPTNGTAEVTIGKSVFELFTRDHTAWSRDSETDKAVTAAMAGGKELTVTIKPAKGREGTVDTYSLADLTAALAAIDKACKYKR